MSPFMKTTTRRFEIWTKEVGVDPSHIVRLGKEDNFWEHRLRPLRPLLRDLL